MKLSQQEAWDLSCAVQAQARGSFALDVFPLEQSYRELVDEIASTWMFGVSLQGPVLMAVTLRFTRPASHFDGSTSQVLDRYRLAAFPDVDQAMVRAAVVDGMTHPPAVNPEAAPRLRAAAQVADAWAPTRAWSISGGRGRCRVVAELLRPPGWTAPIALRSAVPA